MITDTSLKELSDLLYYDFFSAIKLAVHKDTMYGQWYSIMCIGWQQLQEAPLRQRAQRVNRA